MTNDKDNELLRELTRRYGEVSAEALGSVLTPKLLSVRSIDKSVQKLPGQSHWRATFTLEISDDNYQLMQRGRTGKFVPGNFRDDGLWREICKGRIVSVNYDTGIVEGEIYTGQTSSKAALESALEELSEDDLLEIDQYGASAKIVSGLAEYYLSKSAMDSGYIVRRMPEDTAKHLGTYYNYDFEFERDGLAKKIEVKSLWGTNTQFARLIHSTGPNYPTSSCKYETQDIFAVSLFLRTGSVHDFAFAASVPRSPEKPFGLPCAPKYPEHVNQNPKCEIGDGSWFATVDEVWDLE